MSLLPQFRKREDGELLLDYTSEAREVARLNKQRPVLSASAPEKVESDAIKRVKQGGGDTRNRKHVLGQHILQFGQHRGKTFKWMVENGLGYAGWLVDNMGNERRTTAALSVNKFLFKEYVELFEDGRRAVQLKKTEKERKRKAAMPLQMTPVPKSPSAKSLVERFNLPPSVVAQKIAKLSPPKSAPHKASEITDEDLVQHIATIEKNMPGKSTDELPSQISQVTSVPGNFQLELIHDEDPGPSEKPESQLSQFTPPEANFNIEMPDMAKLQSSQTVQKGTQARSVSTHCLPEGWINTLPAEDHAWVANALFIYSSRTGNPELDLRKVDRLWFHPPPPAATCNNKPKVDRYFAHRLFLWMPKRLWQVVLTCPNEYCHGRELTNAGIYQRVRQVVDISSVYYMASEYLECGGCAKKYISWSHPIVEQLDMGHQMQFPLLLTYRYACDKDVVRLLRERGRGNSSSQIRKKLVEEHGETWMQNVALYLSDCAKFASASQRGLLQSCTFQSPPSKPTIPQAAWLMKVHALDVMSRKEEIMSSITSIFGGILKIDSTKKVVKKLAGRAAGTASWQTNVGNEHGQVLTSILTAGEGYGLGPMAQGLMRRYAAAGVSPPKVLYVDKDCCSGNTSRLFADWQNIVVRLDIWHYMRRLASVCTTESHQLYSIFMARLSGCIFEWSQEDLKLLKTAKQHEIEGSGAGQLSPLQWLSKRELALHCRRRTRGAQRTESLIQELLEHFSGDAGLDTMGVPLIDQAKVWEIWESQKKHISCIQDPLGIPLYAKTGTLIKGGIQLPTFRCARGSTSLESFHLHLNRFIPGTAARDEYFQAYLIEGLLRWNENRAAVIKEDVRKHLISRPSYNSKVLHSINKLSQSVLGKDLFPQFQIPMKYTGELMGVEYLYSQTGQVLQDLADSAVCQDDDDETTAVDDDINNEPNEDPEDPTINMPSSEQVTSPPDRQQPTGPSIPQDPELNPGWDRVRRRLHLETVQPPTAQATATASSSTAPPPTVASTSSPQSPPAQTDETQRQEQEKQPSNLEVTIGPDSIPGYDAVENLSEYLVELRHDGRALTGPQAEEICKRWDALSDYDKRATKFSPRHKGKVTSGRFKVTKSPTVQGVDSTKRCFLGGNTGPAQWPDCNRLVEATVIRLCSLYPSPVREGGKVTMRWTLVTRAYKNIREKVVQCPVVMERTTIQLVAINNTTLTQWFNRREKRLEKEVLNQGVTLEEPSMDTSEPLPEPVFSPQIQVLPADVPRHVYTLPQNTAGMGRKPGTRMQPILPATPLRPVSVTPPMEMVLPSMSPPTPRLSRTAEWYRRRKEKDTGKAVRTYTRSCVPKTCSKCGKQRTADTGHRQYKGNWHCEEKDTISFQEMKEACIQKFEELKRLKEK